MSRIRVARVIARMNVGGPARQIGALMTGLPSDEFDQVLITGSVGPDEADAADDGAYPVIRVPGLGRAVRPSSDAEATVALWRELRRFRPQIVHTHTAKAGALVRPLAFAQRAPGRIHTFHGHLLNGYFPPAKTRLVVAAERNLARLSTHLLAVGERVRADLLAAGIGRPGSFGVMPPGIMVPTAPSRQEARSELGVPQDAFVIAVVGRITGVKRPDRLLEVIRTVVRAVPHTVVLVAGDGDLGTQMRSDAADLPVRFLGWRDDVGAVHAASDVSLLASDNEGMPVSLIEAAMVGRPAVATDVGGVSQVVVDGVTGFVCPVDVSALAASVIAVADNPEAARRMGDVARTRALDSFSAQRLVVDHAALYRTSLSRISREGVSPA